MDGDVTRYLYEYSNVVLEVNGSGVQTAVNVYGSGILTRDGQNLMHNGHGDVTAIVSVNTVVASYYYDAFGNHRTASGGESNPYRYAGYHFDSETGLYYLNARFYDPETARFLQEDTYRGKLSDPLSLNLYTYCVNNPVRYWDPSGHWAVGDEKYDAKTQAILAKATTDYFNAMGKNDTKGMAAAVAVGNAARASGTISSSNVNSTGQAYTNAITSSSTKDSTGSKVLTTSSWGTAVVTQVLTEVKAYASSSGGGSPALMASVAVGLGASSANVRPALTVSGQAGQKLSFDIFKHFFEEQRSGRQHKGHE